jgi:cytochrome d ubiquinol oxidase subunit I
MERVGEVAGPLLGYEVLTAFFLEASFLGIMLFGHQRVSERVHLASTFLVALGTTVSAFWILCLDSWMQTPAGTEVVDGVFHVTSWLGVLTNPSFPYRLAHMLLASTLTVAFLMAGVSAWQLLRRQPNASTSTVMRVALTVALAVVPLQILVGDAHGLNTLEHQPQKVAAMEGLWHTERGAPLLLFAWPDERAQVNRAAIEVPHGAALILRHDPQGELRGLDEFPGAHPPVAPVFFAFRAMVGMGLAMLVAAAAGVWWLRRRAWRAEAMPRALLVVLASMTFSGWVATLAGWYVTEVGRQPFIVYGLVRTADVASKVAGGMILSTLLAYLAVYAVLGVAFVTVIASLALKPVKTGAAARQVPSPAPAGAPVLAPEGGAA